MDLLHEVSHRTHTWVVVVVVSFSAAAPTASVRIGCDIFSFDFSNCEYLTTSTFKYKYETT